MPLMSITAPQKQSKKTKKGNQEAVKAKRSIERKTSK
jgi:hypothetical protein